MPNNLLFVFLLCAPLLTHCTVAAEAAFAVVIVAAGVNVMVPFAHGAGGLIG